MMGTACYQTSGLASKSIRYRFTTLALYLDVQKAQSLSLFLTDRHGSALLLQHRHGMLSGAALKAKLDLLPPSRSLLRVRS
jgi:hypothetical protein